MIVEKLSEADANGTTCDDCGDDLPNNTLAISLMESTIEFALCPECIQLLIKEIMGKKA